jgi:hypothetical protein
MMLTLAPIEIFSLRQSSLSQCELQTYFRLSLPPPPPTGAMKIGSIFHEVIAQFCQNEMTADTALALAESKYLDALQDTQIEWDSKIDWWGRLENYLRLYLPFAEGLRGKIVDCEHFWELRFRDLTLSGTFDGRIVAEVCGAPKGIIDHKTSSTLPSAREYFHSPQTFFYCIAARILFGELMPITYAVACLGSKHVKIFTVRKTEVELNNYLEYLYALWLRLKAGIVAPKRGFWCSWCNYRQQCQEESVR